LGCGEKQNANGRKLPSPYRNKKRGGIFNNRTATKKKRARPTRWGKSRGGDVAKTSKNGNHKFFGAGLLTGRNVNARANGKSAKHIIATM